MLLVLFVVRQRTARDPLLPLRVLLDRNRGASFVAILAVGAGMFGAFLFVTYYMQTVLDFDPWTAGLAWLPLIVLLVTAAQLTTNVFLPRFGPKVMVPIGLVLASAGLLLLTQLTLDSAYATHVLPGLLLMGAGMGTAMPSSIQTATLGVDREHAGVASALVSTSQQVGGAVGTAVLNTLATTAATAWVADHATTVPSAPGVLAEAAMHSFTTAFWWSAVIFAAGAVVAALLFRRRGELPTPALERPEEVLTAA